MNEINDFYQLAEAIGFSHISALNMDALVPLREVRDMCASGRCQAYGHLWSCPPACGSIEFTTRRMKQYSYGILVQTTKEMSDDFDAETMKECELLHKKNFEILARQSRKLQPDCLPLTAGGCRICMKCAYPDKPCRFPGRMMSSMEAYGLLVSDVCIRSGLKYNYGPKTMTYSSCILYK